MGLDSAREHSKYGLDMDMNTKTRSKGKLGAQLPSPSPSSYLLIRTINHIHQRFSMGILVELP